MHAQAACGAAKADRVRRTCVCVMHRFEAHVQDPSLSPVATEYDTRGWCL